MSQTLHLLIWPDYINPLTIRQFEFEFNANVEIRIVPSAVELVEVVRAGEPVDVLVPPDYAVRELGADNLLLPLDHAKLPNLEHLDPRFRSERPHDPNCRISVVKDWGTTGFMWRTDVVAESPTSWQAFWALAEKYSGKVSVLDSPGEVIGAALKMRGHSYNATDSAALAQARLDLLALRPHLHAFDTNYRPLLTSGAVCLALGWNGDAVALMAQGLPIRYAVPSEGSQLWEDDWAIAANAPNPQLAHEFVNFVMRPAVAAQEAQYTRYATGSAAGRRLLAAEMQTDSATYPSPEVLALLEAGMPFDASGADARAALWAEVRGP